MLTYAGLNNLMRAYIYMGTLIPKITLGYYECIVNVYDCILIISNICDEVLCTIQKCRV